jgi:hypothetical protein
LSMFVFRGFEGPKIDFPSLGKFNVES